MKTFVTLVSCLALATGAAFADQHKKKGKNQEGQQAAQGTPQGNNAQKGKKTGVHYRNQNVSKANAGAGGGAGAGKSKFQEFNVKKQTNAGKHNKHMGDQGQVANAGLQGDHHGKKFEKKHFDLAKNAKSDIPNAKFHEGMKIKNADHWKGNKYVVFKNYKGEWHDKDWWHHHHNHIVFVFGGPYFWDNGYWFPAWGYEPNAFFAYEGPIYAGNPELDPGQVVANVQSALQSQGFYTGDIDGVLGPLTRAALAQYQQSQGFEVTGAIDEPTLESLGMV